MTAQAKTPQAHLWAAFAAATVVAAAAMTNAGADTGAPSTAPSTTVAVASVGTTAEMVAIDWAKVKSADITPAHTVAAYDR